jgi:hypothetical protein
MFRQQLFRDTINSTTFIDLSCLIHVRFAAVLGQNISHYRGDPKMLARLWSDDLVDPANEFVHSIFALSEEKQCSRHIPI